MKSGEKAGAIHTCLLLALISAALQLLFGFLSLVCFLAWTTSVIPVMVISTLEFSQDCTVKPPLQECYHILFLQSCLPISEPLRDLKATSPDPSRVNDALHNLELIAR